jgi:hypothetical protein
LCGSAEIKLMGFLGSGIRNNRNFRVRSLPSGRLKQLKRAEEVRTPQARQTSTGTIRVSGCLRPWLPMRGG